MKRFQEALQKYLDIFAGQESYFVNDKRNLDLFAANPSNDKVEDIRTKLSAINDPDIRKFDLMEDMITHIHSLHAGERLKNGDLTLVEDIATVNAKGQTFNFLHFASVYCNLHQPELFPVFSEQHFDFYRKYIEEQNLDLDPARLNTYPVFSWALNHLVDQLKLRGKLNYLQLRKFGWLYAGKVLEESAAEPVK